MNRMIGIGVLALAAWMAAPMAAQPEGRRERLRERMLERRMTHLQQELNLTGEQAPAVRGIFKESAQQMLELRKKYGLDDPQFKQGVRAAQEQTREKLRGVLNEEQMAKLREARGKRLERGFRRSGR
ncbi:MAG: hypothetical protein JNK48_25605 [Bryobacterales bacterium]|nr:hypothetical protein [Bryobacterales bacterium]